MSVVDGAVVLSAEQDQVVQGGVAAVGPVPDVVGVGPGWGAVAAGKGAAAVADGERGAQGGWDQAGAAADVEGLAVRVEHDPGDGGVAADPPGCFGAEHGTPDGLRGRPAVYARPAEAMPADPVKAGARGRAGRGRPPGSGGRPVAGGLPVGSVDPVPADPADPAVPADLAEAARPAPGLSAAAGGVVRTVRGTRTVRWGRSPPAAGSAPESSACRHSSTRASARRCPPLRSSCGPAGVDSGASAAQQRLTTFRVEHPGHHHGPVQRRRHIQMPAGVHLLLGVGGGHRNQRVPRVRDLPPQPGRVTPPRRRHQRRLGLGRQLRTGRSVELVQRLGDQPCVIHRNLTDSQRRVHFRASGQPPAPALPAPVPPRVRAGTPTAARPPSPPRPRPHPTRRTPPAAATRRLPGRRSSSATPRSAQPARRLTAPRRPTQPPRPEAPRHPPPLTSATPLEHMFEFYRDRREPGHPRNGGPPSRIGCRLANDRASGAARRSGPRR